MAGLKNAPNRRVASAIDVLTQECECVVGGVQFKELPLKQIQPYHDHKFRLYEGERLDDMVESIKDKSIVYTYGIDLTKTFSESGDATKVKFILKNKTDDYYLTATGSDGVYYVTGQASDEKGATVLSPSAQGKLLVNGMEADTYILTEIGTDKGYSLLKGDILVEIFGTDTAITPSVATVTGTANDRENLAVTMNASARAAVDNTETAMSADDNSANALVQISVLNSKTFTLPQTGGAGTWAVTIVGIAGAGLGALLLVKNRKKA